MCAQRQFAQAPGLCHLGVAIGRDAETWIVTSHPANRRALVKCRFPGGIGVCHGIVHFGRSAAGQSRMNRKPVPFSTMPVCWVTHSQRFWTISSLLAGRADPPPPMIGISRSPSQVFGRAVRDGHSMPALSRRGTHSQSPTDPVTLSVTIQPRIAISTQWKAGLLSPARCRRVVVNDG